MPVYAVIFLFFYSQAYGSEDSLNIQGCANEDALMQPRDSNEQEEMIKRFVARHLPKELRTAATYLVAKEFLEKRNVRSDADAEKLVSRNVVRLLKETQKVGDKKVFHYDEQEEKWTEKLVQLLSGSPSRKFLISAMPYNESTLIPDPPSDNYYEDMMRECERKKKENKKGFSVKYNKKNDQVTFSTQNITDSRYSDECHQGEEETLPFIACGQ